MITLIKITKENVMRFSNSPAKSNKFMKKLLVILMFFALGASFAFAQQPKDKPNPEIQKMVKEIEAKNIEATIRKLVSFGTRNTLSEQDNPTRGIGAARDWIFGEF